MKVISLLQPWASLVVLGYKTIETRSWTTKYRGQVLIHASKGRSGQEIAKKPLIARYIKDFGQLPFGAIIGQAVIKDIIRIDALADSAMLAQLTLEENAFGDMHGKYGWLLTEPVLFDEYIPATGRMGLWEI